jgi:hypothetical protein
VCNIGTLLLLLEVRIGSAFLKRDLDGWSNPQQKEETGKWIERETEK